MSQKVYLHLEGHPGGKNFTIAVPIDAESTAQNVLLHFVEKFAKSDSGFQLNIAELSLRTPTGKDITRTKRPLADIIDDIDDLFVRMTFPTASEKVQTPQPSSSSSGKASPKSTTPSSGKAATKSGADISGKRYTVTAPGSGDIDTDTVNPAAASGSGLSQSTTSPAGSTNDLIDRLKIAISERSYRKTIDIGQHLLKMSPKNCTVLKVLADAYHGSKDYDRAAGMFRKVLKQEPGSSEIHFRLAQSLHAGKEYDEAVLAVETAISLQRESIMKRAQSALKGGKGFSSSTAEKTNELNMIALKSECYFELGQHNEAANIINETMSNPLSETNAAIHLAYAYFAMRYHKVEEAMRALLKTLTFGDNKRAQNMVAQLLDTDQGFRELLRQLPIPTRAQASSSSSKPIGEVYAFMGYICKNHSVILPSIRLYQVSLRLLPRNASYALNLVHVYEVAADYEGAIRAAMDFMRNNPTLQIGPAEAPEPQAQEEGAGSSVCSSGSGREDQQVRMPYISVSCSTFLSVLQRSAVSLTAAAGTAVDPAAGTGAGTGAAPEPPTLHDLRWIEDGLSSHAEVLPQPFPALSSNSQAPTTTTTTTTASVQCPLRNKQWCKITYSPQELDLLALFFTVAKVLYLKGRLSALPALVELLEACRMQSVTPLHQTTIRNEHAYYQELTRVLCFRCNRTSYPSTPTPATSSAEGDPAAQVAVYPLADPCWNATVSAADVPQAPAPWLQEQFPRMAARMEAAARNPIFVLGDSHCIPTAWSIITVRGQPRLLVPKLVTGVKQWHLRSESKFYPKAHFHNMINTIPENSEVVVLIGEIDCREGILLALERNYYENYDQAIQSTLRVFLPVLKEAVLRRKLLRVNVHPIVPVLDITRPMVMRFNRAYKEAVAKLRGLNITWLNFFDELLELAPPDSAAARASAAAISAATSSAVGGTRIVGSSTDATSSAAAAAAASTATGATAATAMDRSGGDSASSGIIAATIAGFDSPMQLRPQYDLDGTHLNPSYLHLLEGSLNY